jgi:tetratricopeptide (TPR) repeat protein
MVQYVKEGRYDDAIQTGLDALQEGPLDAAIYQQIAIVYLIRAQKDSTQRELWLSHAISYAEKALSADPEDPINGNDVGSDFQMAGDLSTDKRCTRYDRGLQVSKRAGILLRRDHIVAAGQSYPIDPIRKDFTAHGHTFRMEPLRKGNDKLSESLKKKMADAGCK